MKGNPRHPADWFKLARIDLVRAERDFAAERQRLLAEVKKLLEEITPAP